MVAKEDNNKEALELFLKIWFDERTPQNGVFNAKVISNAIIYKVCKMADLLYMVATKFPANALKHRPLLLQYIVSSKIKNTTQLEKALPYLSGIGSESLNVEDFEEACGVGVEVSIEEIKAAVREVVNENKEAILAQRYRINVGNLYGQVRKRQPWADAKAVKEIMDGKIFELLGEKTAADEEKPIKKKKEKPPKVEDKVIVADHSSSVPAVEDTNPFLIFPEPGENMQI